MTDYDKIKYQVHEGVASILMDDPDTLNAMTDELAWQMLDAVGRAETEARAIVLGTACRAFSAGGNLSESGFDITDPDRDMGLRLERLINPLILALRSSHLPVVTAVRGAAAGVGCGVALTGDLIVASESAFFLQAFCKVGLTPDGGSTYFLPRTVGRARAMELMLLGERLPAAQALEWGLVNRVVPDDELDNAAFEIASRLAQGPRSLGMIKASAWSGLETPQLKDQLATERHYQREAGLSDDFVEGVTAFREKRRPNFKGR